MAFPYGLMKCAGGLVVAVAVSGCGDGGPSDAPSIPHERSGELGRGDFVYRSLDASDAMMDPAALPAAIAVGGRFDLDFLAGEALPAAGVAVQTGSARVEALGEAFEVKSEGRFVMLAAHQGQVVDLVHLRSLAIAGLAVVDDEDYVTTDLVLTPAQSVVLHALPLEAEGRLLAGALQYRWLGGDDTIVEVRGAGLDPRRVSVRGVRPGTTEIEVSAADAVSVVRVVVIDRMLDSDTTDTGDGRTEGETTAAETGESSGDAGSGQTSSSSGGGR